MSDLHSLDESKARSRPSRKIAKKSATKKASVKRPKKTAGQSGVINLRASAADRSLIDRAAAAAGQNRTEFMMHGARIHAEHVLLSQVYFRVDDLAWEDINATLASPPPANSALKAAFKKVPVWDQ